MCNFVEYWLDIYCDKLLKIIRNFTGRYHMDCLTPALTRVPRGEWFCPVCARVNASGQCTYLYTKAHKYRLCLCILKSTYVAWSANLFAVFIVFYNATMFSVVLIKMLDITAQRYGQLRRATQALQIGRTIIAERVRAVIAQTRAARRNRILSDDDTSDVSEDDYLPDSATNSVWTSALNITFYYLSEISECVKFQPCRHTLPCSRHCHMMWFFFFVKVGPDSRSSTVSRKRAPKKTTTRRRRRYRRVYLMSFYSTKKIYIYIYNKENKNIVLGVNENELILYLSNPNN